MDIKRRGLENGQMEELAWRLIRIQDLQGGRDGTGLAMGVSPIMYIWEVGSAAYKLVGQMCTFSFPQAYGIMYEL